MRRLQSTSQANPAAIGSFILPRTWALVQHVVGVLLEGTPADVNLATAAVVSLPPDRDGVCVSPISGTIAP